MKNSSITLIFVLFSTFFFSQDSIVVKEKNKGSRYFNSTYGLTYSSYRDEATSPLFYNGTGLAFGVGLSKFKSQYESQLDLNLNISANLSKTPENQLYPSKKIAYFINMALHYHHLRMISSLSKDKRTVLIGGTSTTNFNSRINPSLQNATAGIEFLHNFMITGKVNFDISRLEERNLKLWFFKKHLKPKQRTLNAIVNIGLLNFNYRPNYAYLSDADINGSETNWVNYYLNGYQLKMNGWALSSSIEYIRYKENKNALKWSYNWSAYSAPGNYETFQMAMHQVKFTIMFKR